MAITDDDIIKDFFIGFIRLHILYHASREGVFGLNLIKELARHGYSLSAGTLYPMLHRLEESGFLVSEKAIVNGRWRRYYRITEEGKLALSQSYEKIEELSRELMKDSKGAY